MTAADMASSKRLITSFCLVLREVVWFWKVTLPGVTVVTALLAPYTAPEVWVIMHDPWLMAVVSATTIASRRLVAVTFALLWAVVYAICAMLLNGVISRNFFCMMARRSAEAYS